jgi:nitrogen regulatory protein PII 1
MKMIFGVVRPEKIYAVESRLAESGFNAFTRWQVSGRGKQKGICVGDAVYGEILKNAIIVTVTDDKKDEVIDIIMQASKTGENGSSGDGKIFVLPITEEYTVSTQLKDDE